MEEAEQSVGEMRLSAQTDRPSISQRPPHQNLTACESVERKGLGGTSCNWTGIPESR